LDFSIGTGSKFNGRNVENPKHTRLVLLGVCLRIRLDKVTRHRQRSDTDKQVACGSHPPLNLLFNGKGTEPRQMQTTAVLSRVNVTRLEQLELMQTGWND
jgi:hypothetical protein